MTQKEIQDRIEVCPLRERPTGNHYVCTRYWGTKVLCDGACNWVVDYLKLENLKHRRENSMTDKVQKIREEVVRMHNLLPVMDGDNISVNYADRICTTLEMYINSLQEEPVSEELKDACEQLAENARKHKAETSSPFFSQTDYRQGVMDGAKWQKEQLMEKGVDGVVHHFEKCRVASVHYKDPTGVPMSYFMSPKGLMAGDKVKIIVIKEG